MQRFHKRRIRGISVRRQEGIWVRKESDVYLNRMIAFEVQECMAQRVTGGILCKPSKIWQSNLKLSGYIQNPLHRLGP